tara:strand:- start:672 stop:1031 length:360 start_codon:yes stop_codon:yes gene_type:complete
MSKTFRIVQGDPAAGGGMEYGAHQCQRIWKAVLAQACKDASYIGNKDREGLEAQRAQNYLLSGSLDLQLVCELADVNIERVTKWARKCKAENDWKRESFLWSRPRQTGVKRNTKYRKRR